MQSSVLSVAESLKCVHAEKRVLDFGMGNPCNARDTEENRFLQHKDINRCWRHTCGRQLWWVTSQIKIKVNSLRVK